MQPVGAGLQAQGIQQIPEQERINEQRERFRSALSEELFEVFGENGGFGTTALGVALVMKNAIMPAIEENSRLFAGMVSPQARVFSKSLIDTGELNQDFQGVKLSVRSYTTTNDELRHADYSETPLTIDPLSEGFVDGRPASIYAVYAPCFTDRYDVYKEGFRHAKIALEATLGGLPIVEGRQPGFSTEVLYSETQPKDSYDTKGDFCDLKGRFIGDTQKKYCDKRRRIVLCDRRDADGQPRQSPSEDAYGRGKTAAVYVIENRDGARMAFVIIPSLVFDIDQYEDSESHNKFIDDLYNKVISRNEVATFLDENRNPILQFND
ncbi:MAG: hypothetical protein ChlgKO_10760 [Chlamydiales bacterium]